MKKSLLVLAVLSALGSAASAQTSLTVYGIVDAGIVAERGCSGDCAATKVSGGVASGSRLGLQGREALLRIERHEAHLFRVTQHSGGHSPAHVHIKAGPVPLVIWRREARYARADAALNGAALFDGIQRLASKG